MRIRLTAPIDGKASPRKPSAAMRNKSSSGNFEVQCRSTANASSSGVMPPPLSTTAIRFWPPSLSATSMREAPASIAFSTNSLTAAAGRSMTSPAAMRLTRTGGNRRIVIEEVYAFPIVEEMAKADASAAWCLNQGAGCSMAAAYLEPDAAREIFGGPRGILAWGPGPGKARIVKGGYRVTASWSFASGSHNATWLGCHVPIYNESGTQLLHPDGSPVIRTVLFPKSNAEMTDICHVLGLRGTGSGKYSVADFFLP